MLKKLYALSMSVLALSTLFVILSVTAKAAEPANYIKHSPGWQTVECEKIRFESGDMTFHIDEDSEVRNIGAHALPLNTSKREFSYSSSDEEIVSVDADGNVSSHNRPGNATVTVKCGNISRECKVRVIRGVKGISVSRSDMTFYADRPESFKLEAGIYPLDATDRSVKWATQNTAVASVDSNGTVTPCGIGTVAVTVTSNDGGFKATCTVRVTLAQVKPRAVFIMNEINSLRVNGEYKLTANVYPSNTTDKSFTWETSDANIVSIDGDGNIKGIAAGKANLSARSSNGYVDSFEIEIVTDDGAPFVYQTLTNPIADKIKALSPNSSYSEYSSTLSEAIDLQMKQSPTVFSTKASAATKEDVTKYIKPSAFTSGYYKFQFLKLDHVNGASEKMLNTYLSDKGILKDKGAQIIAAARANNISELYLAVHSALESGNGTSKLACGIKYKDKTVYNLFGIGAFDSNPEEGGAKYAYEHNWTSIDEAISGGAKWISENYINASKNKQNTLYKMKWDPEAPGTHQYATDVAWAAKQTVSFGAMAAALEDYDFEVPVYAGEEKTKISYN